MSWAGLCCAVLCAVRVTTAFVADTLSRHTLSTHTGFLCFHITGTGFVSSGYLPSSSSSSSSSSYSSSSSLTFAPWLNDGVFGWEGWEQASLPGSTPAPQQQGGGEASSVVTVDGAIFHAVGLKLASPSSICGVAVSRDGAATAEENTAAPRMVIDNHPLTPLASSRHHCFARCCFFLAF